MDRPGSLAELEIEDLELAPLAKLEVQCCPCVKTDCFHILNSVRRVMMC